MVTKYDIKFSLLTCVSRFCLEIVPRFFFCSSVNILDTQYNLSYMEFVRKDSLTTLILHSCDNQSSIFHYSFFNVFHIIFRGVNRCPSHLLRLQLWNMMEKNLLMFPPSHYICLFGTHFFQTDVSSDFVFFHFDVHSAVVCIQINVGYFIFIFICNRNNR